MATHTLPALLLDKAPVSLLCFFFVSCCIIVSLAGLYFFELIIGKNRLPASNEITGVVFGALSLVYSLILAFVIIAVWQDYEDLDKTIASEADRLNSIMAHSATLPDSVQRNMKSALISYCQQVINKEWQMQHLDVVDKASAIPDLRLMLLRLQPQNKSEEAIYTVLDQDLSNISDLRRNRLSHNRSHVPELVWLILNAGSIILVTFFYFFNISSLPLKRIYLSFLSGYIAMCMFLVYKLDHPFGGLEQVSKQPYSDVLMGLEQYYAVNL